VLAGAGGTYGYPPGTTYLATVAAIGFTAPSGSDPAGFALSSASPYRGGADVAAVMTATAGARALSEAPSAATRGIRVQK
jgi:hypothetical protein